VFAAVQARDWSCTGAAASTRASEEHAGAPPPLPPPFQPPRQTGRQADEKADRQTGRQAVAGLLRERSARFVGAHGAVLALLHSLPCAAERTPAGRDLVFRVECYLSLVYELSA